MRTLLEALGKWNPPAGTVGSVRVVSDEATLDCTATVHIRRPGRRDAAVELRLGYADVMSLSASAIVYRLADAAEAVLREPEPVEPPPPKPEPHRPHPPKKPS